MKFALNDHWLLSALTHPAYIWSLLYTCNTKTHCMSNVVLNMPENVLPNKSKIKKMMYSYHQTVEIQVLPTCTVDKYSVI